MPTVQMNTRMDEELKRQGDAVFAERGYTPSQVVRAVWEYAARNQDLPPFMKDNEEANGSQTSSEAARARADDGAGLALRVAGEQCGFSPMATPDAAYTASEFTTWRELRDETYDERLRELKEGCGL